jgi:heat shock protein HtpX
VTPWPGVSGARFDVSRVERAHLVVLAAIGLVLGLVVGVVVGLLAAGALGGLIGGVLGVAIGPVAGTVVSVRRRDRAQGAPGRIVAALGAVRSETDEAPRVHNLVEGLCLAHGVARPVISVVDTPSCNVLVTSTSTGEAHLVVTSGLVEACDRVELEGVLAHGLARLRTGEAALTTLGCDKTGRIVERLVERLGGKTVTDDFMLRADLAACQLTRYPPALASAFERFASVGTSVPGVDPSTVPLWIADPLGRGDGKATNSESRMPRVHPPLDERIAVLREL